MYSATVDSASDLGHTAGGEIDWIHVAVVIAAIFNCRSWQIDPQEEWRTPRELCRAAFVHPW